jgi:hypothetical protein
MPEVGPRPGGVSGGGEVFLLLLGGGVALLMFPEGGGVAFLILAGVWEAFIDPRPGVFCVAIDAGISFCGIKRSGMLIDGRPSSSIPAAISV